LFRASSDDLVAGMPVARHCDSPGPGEDISLEQSVGYAPIERSAKPFDGTQDDEFSASHYTEGF